MISNLSMIFMVLDKEIEQFLYSLNYYKKISKNSFIAHIGGDDFFVGLTDFAFEDVFKLTLDVQNEFEYSAKICTQRG